MAHFSKFQANDFWPKKFRRQIEVHVTNKSGDISRADFEVVVDRYRQLGTASEQFLEKLTKSLMKFADMHGITDASVKMSYDDYEAGHMKVLSREGEKPASPDDKLQFALDILLLKSAS